MFRLNIAIWRQIARRQHADITTMNVVPIIISAIALVFLATELNFRFVEKPFIVLGHRIAAGIRKKSVASAGGAHSPQAT
jgi:peptidoglycan/LPS O-acetylase OafA/YrhL